MPDMLVKLYELPPLAPAMAELEQAGVVLRRALAPEKHHVIQWVREHFNEAWVSECEVAFTRQPVSCLIAIREGQLLGFACHEATARNFFGPTGVSEQSRGLGVGKGLLLASMHAMRELGYGYAIIGGVGPKEFYAKQVGAVEIADSTPGIYQGILQQQGAAQSTRKASETNEKNEPQN